MFFSVLLTLLHGGVGDLVGLLRALPDGVVDGGLVLQEVGADDAVVDHGRPLQGRHAVQQERALQERGGNHSFTDKAGLSRWSGLCDRSFSKNDRLTGHDRSRRPQI